MFTCRKTHGHGRGKGGGGRNGHILGLAEYRQCHSGRGRSVQRGCAPPHQECKVSEMNRAAAGATCPLCKNHCPLSDPGCPKGEAIARSITPQG